MKLFAFALLAACLAAMLVGGAHAATAAGSALQSTAYNTTTIPLQGPLVQYGNRPVNITADEGNVSAGIIARMLNDPYGTIELLVATHGYTSLFLIMLLEGTSFPVPSELVIPLAGYFAQRGLLDPIIAFISILSGSSFGLAIDYYIGYWLGRDFFYKHMHLLRIKKSDMDRFDEWFARNGTFAVFVSRLLPVVRTVMSFPAGFAGMPKSKFFAYSVAGIMIWDAVLMTFGYYVLSTQDAVLVATGIGVIALASFYLYRRFVPYGDRHAGAGSGT